MTLPIDTPQEADMHTSTGETAGNNQVAHPLLPLGTRTPWGKIGAITNQGGERYYMMSKNKGRDVALMPADLVEDMVSTAAKSDSEADDA